MRKTMIMTAALAGLVAASHAAVTAVNYDGSGAFDAGEYELLTGGSTNFSYNQSLTTFRGQTVSVTNDFELGAISIMYNDSNQDVIVSNMLVYVDVIDDPHAASYTIPGETNLFKGTFNAPPTSGTDTLYLALGTNISLKAGSYYMVRFDNTEADSVHFDWARSTTEGVYAGGQRVKNDALGYADRDFSLGLGLAPPLTANDDIYLLPYNESSADVAAPGVLVNDLGYDSAVLVTNISSGSLTFNADGSFSCSDLVHGSNTFSYAVVSGTETSTPATVLLFASLEADIPISVDDTFVMDWAYGDHIEGNVLNNDTNTSSTFEMFAVLENPTGNGAVSFSTDGSFTYTPNGGFSGVDTFTYMAYTEIVTGAVATVTLNVESNATPGMVIDAFETYDNSASLKLADIPAAAANWNPANSGFVQIQDRGGNGPSYQYLKVGWDSKRYRGAMSIGDLFAGIPDSSTEYWLYCELNLTSTTSNGCFGVTVNPVHTVASAYRGDFDAGVRLYGDGSGTLDLYAFTGGGVSNDVLLTSGLEAGAWHGIWLNINNAANTYDVYLGEAGNPGIPGAQVGSDIGFVGVGDLVAMVASSQNAMYVDNIMNLDAIPAYTMWVTDQGLTSGVNDDYGDDPDADDMDNLLEYALGGNALSNDAAMFLPGYEVTVDGSTNYLNYVYRRYINYDKRGLNYEVGAGDDLVFEPLTNATEYVDAGVIDADFESVTNRVSMDEEEVQFMQLKVTID